MSIPDGVPWTGLTFGTNWSNYGTFEVGSFTKDDHGWVSLRGLVGKSVAWVNNDVVATLPSGCRPVNPQMFVSLLYDSSIGIAMIRTDVSSSGAITLILGGTVPNIVTPGNASYLTLNAIRFWAGY